MAGRIMIGWIAAACCVLAAAGPGAGGAAAARGGAAETCPGDRLLTADGCTAFGEAGRAVREIVRDSLDENGLRAALVRVDVGGRTLATASPGESMAGVPATASMRFRIGSIAIPSLMDLLFQLEAKGRLSLDDPVAEWFPDAPNADRVTLRMLASATSGYADWAQGNPDFLEALFEDPFRQWRSQELLRIGLERPLACEPGACFHYAHTGFAILARVVNDVTGRPVERLLRTRVFRPLRLRDTAISSLPPIPSPALHAYMGERGVYEDSTYWSPSWGISKSLLMTATLADVVKLAEAWGTGRLVTPAATRERLEPITAGLPGPHPFDRDYYYGLGVLVLNGWVFQNPNLNGYASIGAYLPEREIALALTATRGAEAAATDENYAELLFAELAEYLAPNHPAELPG